MRWPVDLTPALPKFANLAQESVVPSIESGCRREPSNAKSCVKKVCRLINGDGANREATIRQGLSPSTLQSGCVKVIPGTHRLDQIPHVETGEANNLLSRGQEVAVDVEEADAVAMPLQPGEMSLHHIRTIHNSEPNRSNDRRIGFAIRYIPAHVRQMQVHDDTATLLRGEDRFGHFELEPRPTHDWAPEAVAYHAEIMRRRATIYGSG